MPPTGDQPPGVRAGLPGLRTLLARECGEPTVALSPGIGHSLVVGHVERVRDVIARVLPTRRGALINAADGLQTIRADRRARAEATALLRIPEQVHGGNSHLAEGGLASEMAVGLPVQRDLPASALAPQALGDPWPDDPWEASKRRREAVVLSPDDIGSKTVVPLT